MRTTTIYNESYKEIAKIEYPGEVAFSFNPQRITITGQDASNAITGVTITIDDYAEDIAPIENEASADVSIFARALFDETNYLSSDERIKTMSVNVAITFADSNTYSAPLSWQTIWGAIAPGEVYNDIKVVRWFANYPMMIELYANSWVSLYAITDKEPINEEIQTTETSGIVSLNPADVFNEETKPMVYSGSIRIGSFSTARVWDNTFDFTFGNFESEWSVRVIKDDRTCGVFLRWIDKHGFLRYFLFDKGEDTTSASEYGEAMPDTYMSDASRYYGGMMRDQGKTTERKMTIQATALSADEFDYIRTVGISPFVDMYIGNGLWQPVRVSDGDYSRFHKGTARQNIEIEITYLEETQRR